MVYNASLFNTQHYKIRIKGKVEQSRKRSCAPSPIPWCSSYGKGSLQVLYIYIYASGGVMVSKRDYQTYTRKFESHWVPYLYALRHIKAKSLVNYFTHTHTHTHITANYLSPYETDRNNSFRVDLFYAKNLQIRFINPCYEWSPCYISGESEFHAMS